MYRTWPEQLLLLMPYRFIKISYKSCTNLQCSKHALVSSFEMIYTMLMIAWNGLCITR
jgi:hypothetical protein